MNASHAQPTGQGQSGARAWPWLLLALAATAAVHLRALGGSFVYDDLHLVLGNPALQGVGELIDSLTGPYWGFVEGEASAGVGFWRPLSTVALFAGDRLGGGAPWGFHAVSIGLHLAATAAAFALLRGLTANPLAAGVGALLFGLHPVQVESVAWISAVNDPLAGLCVLAGLERFRAWREAESGGSSGLPLGAMFWLAIGLLAKESAVAMVPLALALDLSRGTARPLWKGYAPLALVGLGWWAVRALVFSSPFAGFDLVTSHLFVPTSRLVTLRVELFGGALALLTWPAELNLFREVRPELPSGDPQLTRAWIALGIWAAATLGAALTKRRNLLFALLVVPAAMAPALLAFTSIGRFPLSERFLYVPCLSVALIAASALAATSAQGPRRPLHLAALIGALLLAGLGGLRSSHRVEFWSSELNLFRHAVAASPNSAYVRWGLGRVLLDEFQATGDPVTLEEAHQAFTTAQDLSSPKDGPPDPTILITPNDQIQASLGVAWCYLLSAGTGSGDHTFEEAELIFGEIALRTAGTHFVRSHARAQLGLGIARSRLGKDDLALLALTEATNLAPELSEAWYTRGELERELGQMEAAQASFARALDRAPRDVDTLVAMAGVSLNNQQPAEARRLVQQALALDPEAWKAHEQLGLLAGLEADVEAALAHFDRALAIDPAAASAHLNRAKALLQLGRLEDAIPSFQSAARLAPRNFEAHYNLGVLLMSAGLTTEANGHLRAALAADPDHELADRIRQALRASGG